jgi:NhaA family Na+:H+ antiporter
MVNFRRASLATPSHGAPMTATKYWWERDTAPGYALLAATALSFVLLNSPLGTGAQALLDASFAALGDHALNLRLVINDGLMAVFFLYASLELKRETIEGPFSNPREAVLPIAGALGGMIAPALIYIAVNAHEPAYLRGWAIPAATDISFALGAMSLLGARVPSGLRLFLLALAIIDDLGAILIIALFYSTHLTGWALGGAAAAFVLQLLLNRAGVVRLWPYWALGLVMWAFMLLSGVHPTVAGVLTAMAVPMRARDGASPLIDSEHALKPWVQFAIMPLFALVNAGVVLAEAGFSALIHPIAIGAGAGLLLGKPIGITLGAYFACMILKQRAPGRFAQMLGMGSLAGVGFTMSLFIGNLAFGAGPLAAPVRFGVLSGSFLSALLGLLVLWWFTRGVSRAHATLGPQEDVAEARGVIEDIDPR